MKNAEILRAKNRALINNLYNGVPPYTDAEVRDNKIYVNVNWKEGTNTLHSARGQYENAFLKPGQFFKVQLDDAPMDKADEWSRIITQQINKTMKRSAQYLHTQRSTFAGVALHGVGAKMWENDFTWLPFFVGIQDILMPTDTDITMENLQYFAVRRKMKPGELYIKALKPSKENVDPAWNVKLVKKIIDDLKDQNFNPNNYNWSNHPEQMAELYKQNVTYYTSDRAPDVWLWDFYFKEVGEDGKMTPGWYRAMILDTDCSIINASTNESNSNPIQFVYRPIKPFSDSLTKIVHFQFGDGNNVPPFKYHSIRSLGWLLYDVLQLMNRLRCQFTQHVFEQMLMLFRVTDSTDRARIQKILLFDKGVIPDGTQIVPANERYQVDTGLVGMLMANLKQLVTESSSSYTQAIDTGTEKERTKFEVEAIMSQISFLMSSMLNLAYFQEYFAMLEICRRFTQNPTEDFDVKKFRAACIKAGVPAKYIDAERWTITLEQVLGAGNKMLEIAQARELRGMRPTLDPGAQREVDRLYISSLTDNPRLADFLVPDAPKTSDSTHDAELAFGTLMQGTQMTMKDGLNHHDQVKTLLRLMGGVIKQIKDTDGMGTPQQIAGLQNVAQYIGQHIQIIAEDDTQKEQVKEYTDILSNFMNLVRAFAQRQAAAQKAQQNGGADPGAAAAAAQQLAAQQAKDQQSLQSKQQQHDQKLAHRQQEFQQKQQLDNAGAISEIERKNAQAAADVHTKGVKAGAEALIATTQGDEAGSTGS